MRAIDRAQKDLAARTVELTDGEVEKATQRDKLLAHLLAEYDIDLPDMKKSTLERRINDPDLPDPLRELLAIRLEATMTSSSKYKTLLRGVSADGRLRGLMQFCGAARTGRVAHRLTALGDDPR
ncbi:DNA polymerase I, partial [Burkholderia cenocepacia]|nr:DNA polymerase I [Burkholderia cenocepacia]